MASSETAETDARVPNADAPDPAYVRALEAEVRGLHERVDRLAAELDRRDAALADAEAELERVRSELREREAELERTEEWRTFLESEVRTLRAEVDGESGRDDGRGLVDRLRAWLGR